MKPSIGRIVHFVQQKADADKGVLVHLPAFIAAVWSDICVNLQVFTDGTNSDYHVSPGTIKWMTKILLSETPVPGSWHWPERE